MNFLVYLFFVFLGLYGPIVSVLKQAIFQGQDIVSSPWTYLSNPRFMVSVTLLAVFAQAVWVLEGVARQKISYSNMFGYSSLIIAPVNAVANLFALWISEQYLRDKIVWWAAVLVILGNCLGMIGGTYLLKGGKT